jgi:hypothetical protein
MSEENDRRDAPPTPAYTLCLAALVLVGGSLGDHLGR